MGAEHPLDGIRRDDGRPSRQATCRVPACHTCRRLRRAAVEHAARHGIPSATTEAIAACAGVSARRATLHYATADECVVAAYAEGVAHLRRRFARALDRPGSWRQRLDAAADATAAEFEARSELARFCVVEAWRADPVALRDARITARQHSVALLAEHAQEPEGEDLPALRLELLAGAVHHALNEQLQSGECDADAVRDRLHQLIALFEPIPA